MGFFSRLTGQSGSSAPLSADEQRILLDAVNAVDPLLKTVSGFERKLTPAARQALDYCAGLAQAIPGPIEIDTRAYSSNPLVHAFFATHTDIEAMMGRSHGVRSFLAAPENCTNDAFFCLLGMRLHEKSVMGLSMQGDIIRSDVPQRVLYFGDHTLRELASGPDATRQHLRAAGFYSLARSFGAQLDEQRDQRKKMRLDREMASAQAHGQEDSPHARRRDDLDEQLRQAAQSLLPERILDAFIAWLGKPELQLRLKPTTVTIDRMGVVVPPAPDNAQISTLQLTELVFPELISRDRRRWISVLTRIRRDEALAAIEQQREASRFIII